MVGSFLKSVVHVRTFFNVKVSVVESFPVTLLFEKIV